MPLANPTGYQRKILAVPEDVSIAQLSVRGNGKTTAEFFVILRDAVQYGSDCQALFNRDSHRGVSQAFDDFLQLAHDGGLEPRGNKTDGTIKLSTGATVTFDQLSDRRDWFKYQGRSFSCVVMDEVTNADLQLLGNLKSLLRSSNKAQPLRWILSGNAGGSAHGALYLQYVQGRKPWTIERTINGEKFVLATGEIDDNEHIDVARYKASLLAAAGSDRELYKAWTDCSVDAWAISRGGMFVDCWSDRVILRGNLNLGNLRVLRPKIGGDFGIASPCVAYLGVVSDGERIPFPRGSLLVLDEVAFWDPERRDYNKGGRQSFDELTDAIKGMWRKWCGNTPPVGVFDQRGGNNTTDDVISLFNRSGIMVRAPHKPGRVARIVRIRNALHAATQGLTDQPQLLIHERCEYAIATIPKINRDERHPEDTDPRAADHALDALGYLLGETARTGSTGVGRVVGVNIGRSSIPPAPAKYEPPPSRLAQSIKRFDEV